MTDEEIVFNLLKKHGGMSTKRLICYCPKEWRFLELPETEKYKAMTVSNLPEGRSRMHHALAKLKAKGLAENPSRGYWQLV
jgi:hypothetical protein